MASASDTAGQERVNQREINNRRGPGATGMAATTPKKRGQMTGIRNNRSANGGVFRSVRGNANR